MTKWVVKQHMTCILNLQCFIVLNLRLIGPMQGLPHAGPAPCRACPMQGLPHAGPAPCRACPSSWRIGPIRFLAEWRKKHPSQVFVSLCLVLCELLVFSTCSLGFCVVRWLQLDFVHSCQPRRLSFWLAGNIVSQMTYNVSSGAYSRLI